MEIFERMVQIRKYRGLTQEDVSRWFKCSKQAWGRKERGLEGGFGPADLVIFLERTQIDPRFLFGLAESLEEADLTKHPINTMQDEMAGIRADIREIQKKVKPITKIDPLCERVMGNEELYNFIQLIQFWDASMIRRLTSYAHGYIDGREDESKRGHAAG